MKLNEYQSEITHLLKVLGDRAPESGFNVFELIGRLKKNEVNTRHWWFGICKQLLKVPGFLDQVARIENYKLIKSYVIGDAGNAFLDGKDEAIAALDKPVEKIQALPSSKVSLQMKLKGQTVEQIAQARKLKSDTIVKHLLRELKGDFPFDEYVTGEKMATIVKVLNAEPEGKMSSWKEALPDDISYLDIEVVRVAKKAKTVLVSETKE